MRTIMNIDERAKEFSYERHSNQKRKGKEIPYTNHLDLVNYILSTLTNKEEILAVGWLHDVVEDTDTSLNEIFNIFGDRIGHLVDLETEKKEKDSINSWKKRKESQLEKLKSLGENDLEVLLVTLSDKMSNLMEIYQDYLIIGDKIWERFNNKDKKDHYWYHNSFHQIFIKNKSLFKNNANILNSYKTLIDKFFLNEI